MWVATDTIRSGNSQNNMVAWVAIFTSYDVRALNPFTHNVDIIRPHFYSGGPDRIWSMHNALGRDQIIFRKHMIQCSVPLAALFSNLTLLIMSIVKFCYQCLTVC